MTDTPSRDQIVDALKAMSDDEARDTFNQARGQDRTAKQAKAARAVRDYQRGITVTRSE